MKAQLLFTRFDPDRGGIWFAGYGLPDFYAGGRSLTTKTRAIMEAMDRWKRLLTEMANDPIWQSIGAEK